MLPDAFASDIERLARFTREAQTLGALNHRHIAQTDIWAFGCVLYEMLTGKRAFAGENISETIAEVLKSEPNWNALPTTIHPRLRELLDRCLQKDVTQRWQSIGDVRIELGRTPQHRPDILAASSVPTQAVGWQARAIKRTAWVVSAGLIAILATGIVTYWIRAGATQDVAESSPLSTSFAPLTVEVGTEQFPSLSPDGRWMVYAGDTDGDLDIYLRAVGAGPPINLTRDSPTDDNQPAFSLDGERIAFRSEREGGGIFVMGRTGESPRKVTRRGFHPSWPGKGATPH